jgi:hypothetical protein
LGIGDWAQSPIPNPQSPIPNPQSPIPIYKKIIFPNINLFKKIKITNYLIILINIILKYLNNEM